MKKQKKCGVFRSMTEKAQRFGAMALSLSLFLSAVPTLYIAADAVQPTITGLENPNQDILIQATAQTVAQGDAVSLFYKEASQMPYEEISMTKKNGVYSAFLSRESLWGDALIWYVQAESSTGEVVYQSDETTSTVMWNTDYAAQSPILVTEVMTANIEAGKYYDYVELYNNSDTPFPIGHYTFYYQASSVTREWNCAYDQVIEPHQSLVVWIGKNKNLTIADFNKAYGTDLVENQDIVKVYYSAGLHISSERTYVIGYSESDPLYQVQINENGADLTDLEGTSIHYTYPRRGGIEGIKVTTALSCSPGTVEDWQVPRAGQAVADFDDTIADEDVPPLLFTEAMTIDTDNGQFDFVEIYNNSTSPLKPADFGLSMDTPVDETYRLTEWELDPELELAPGDTLVVWFAKGSGSSVLTVEDFNREFQTDLIEGKDIIRLEYNAGINNNSMRRYMLGKIASVKVNKNGADVTADQGRNRQSIQYTYPPNMDGESMKVQVAAATPGSVEAWQIPGQPVDFDYDKAPAPLVAPLDVPTSIDEGEELFAIFETAGNGIAAVDGEVNPGEDDPENPDGDTQEETVDAQLLGMSVYYRLPGQENFTSIYEESSRVLGRYFARIPATVMLGYDSIEFYVEAYNRYKTTRTETYTVQINRETPENGIRLEPDNGSVVSGVTSITANDGRGNQGMEIAVDGQPYTVSPALENGAYFCLDVDGLANYYKNAVTASWNGEDEVIGLLYNWRGLPSRALHVDGKFFTANADGSYTVKLTLRAGTHGTPFEDIFYPEQNRDNYTVTHLKLYLSNGEFITPSRAVQSYPAGNFSLDLTNPPATQTYSVGDSANGEMAPTLDVYFTIPADKLTAAGIVLDTSALSDGTHRITAENAAGAQVSAEITVDNTAPVVKAGIADGALITGDLIVDPVFEDASGMDGERLSATLDGKDISLPYRISTRQLASGPHTLCITAYDAAGNHTAVSVSFATDTRDPAGVQTQTNGITEDAATLTVTVDDLGADAGNVTFYSTQMITDITVASGTSGHALSYSTQEITTTAPAGRNPYQIFTLDVGSVGANDMVTIDWKGSASHADASHALCMYALNTTENTWDLVGQADEQGCIQATFAAGSYLAEDSIQILVECLADGEDVAVTVPQADIPEDYVWDGTGRPVDYDFAFAWMTDTQHYSERFPQHYISQNEWLVEHAEELKIEYVLHTGDIVDEWDMLDQWERASASMKILDDAGLPYGVLAGNHDVAGGSMEYEHYWDYFGSQRFEDRPYYGGSLHNNLAHYDLITAGGQDFIIVYVSWDVFEDEINWMNEVLEQYKDRKAIIATHRGTKVIPGETLLDYTGQMLQDYVVSKNPNVFAVLNGHYHGASIQVDGFDDDGDGVYDRQVYNICTDYQSDAEGGSEYMKFLYFDLENDKIYINSYSPYCDDYNYFNRAKLYSYDIGTQEINIDIAELCVDFDTAEKTLVTSQLTAAVHSQDALESVPITDRQASFIWENLDPSTTYGWCARITNENGGELLTIAQLFSTEASDTSDPSGGQVNPDENGDTPDTNPQTGDQPHGIVPLAFILLSLMIMLGLRLHSHHKRPRENQEPS